MYRNVKFLNLEQFDISKIMQYLIDYFEKNNLRSLHLHDYFYQTKGKYPEIEYFTLRHLVREYGERYNLYFNGKSGADTVSLDSEITLISQLDVIIKVLNESKVAMTKQEIAERIKSKSINHAAFYLSNLIEEGKVVRVDRMVYTTHEKAFKNIDTEAVMRVIRTLMDNSNRIVEADVFREYVNLELNLSYSKYIYMALVRTKIAELNWHHKRTLFSIQEIQYENLSDLCNKTCYIRLTDSENSENIQKVAWLTNAIASMAIQQWKVRMK
jgi:hypothetical protein